MPRCWLLIIETILLTLIYIFIIVFAFIIRFNQLTTINLISFISPNKLNLFLFFETLSLFVILFNFPFIITTIRWYIYRSTLIVLIFLKCLLRLFCLHTMLSLIYRCFILLLHSLFKPSDLLPFACDFTN